MYLAKCLTVEMKQWNLIRIIMNNVWPEIILTQPMRCIKEKQCDSSPVIWTATNVLTRLNTINVVIYHCENWIRCISREQDSSPDTHFEGMMHRNQLTMITRTDAWGHSCLERRRTRLPNIWWTQAAGDHTHDCHVRRAFWSTSR